MQPHATRSFAPFTSPPAPRQRRSESFSAAAAIVLLSRFARKRSSQRNRGDVTRRAVRFPGIVREVFLNDANDLDRRHSAGDASHPVPSRNIQQSPIHQEAFGKAFRPAQTRGVSLDARRISVPFTVYAPFRVDA